MRPVGRGAECEALDRLLADTLAGRSRVLALRGEAGVGKSALLRYLSDRVAGWRVATADGVESEMGLAYSGLHQLCAPLLEDLHRLPDPQRDALARVFGLSAGPAPTRFLVGLASLTLLATAAEHDPFICIVDDAQWLDQTSVQILGFVARRLITERIALVCAARLGSGDHVLAGQPELTINGLNDKDARALLLNRVHGPFDAAVCDQVIAECHGNPLALLELPRSWSPADLAGGFGLPDGRALGGDAEQSYTRRLRPLPDKTRLLVLTAAAEPMGDPALLQRAAQLLGFGLDAAAPAVDAGLLRVDRRVEFAHPHVRSAVYHSAAVEDRQRVHRILAEATDATTDPDRRAWHRGRGAPGPREEVAAELEGAAEEAQARGGFPAAAAFLKRAVALTVDPARRGERALCAAQASVQAGEFEATLRMLAAAEREGTPNALQRGRIDLLRAQVAFTSGASTDAPWLLLRAARRLEPFDLELSREAYLSAWGAAVSASATRGGELLEISQAVRALPTPRGKPRPLDLLLVGFALLATEGHAAAASTLQQAAAALGQLPTEQVLRWGWAATGASVAVWDQDGFHAVAGRQLQVSRGAGALGRLPLHLSALAMARASRGDLTGAAHLLGEVDSVAATTGARINPYAWLRLRALQGREYEGSAEIANVSVGSHDHWAAATLHNGLARYHEAAMAAQQAIAGAADPWVSMWALPELVEAAGRGGETELARDALNRLTDTTRPIGNDLARGIEARCQALVSAGATAEDRYLEAVRRLTRTKLRPEFARAHLLYGEWLRREGRRIDAREQLRTAHDLFAAMGMEAFAERARRELNATGERVRKRRDQPRDRLTPQEEQIARLARDGLSNPEISAQLFISARTVEWHLRKVFMKLGITSRRQLRSSDEPTLTAMVDPASGGRFPDLG